MPFEMLLPATVSGPQGQGEIERVLTSIEAVRAAIGDDVQLMVDCHWRLDEAGAMAFRNVSLVRVCTGWSARYPRMNCGTPASRGCTSMRMRMGCTITRRPQLCIDTEAGTSIRTFPVQPEAHKDTDRNRRYAAIHGR
jgi:hypothetical protein